MVMTTPDIRYDDPAIATDGLPQQYVATRSASKVKKWRPPASTHESTTQKSYLNRF